MIPEEQLEEIRTFLKEAKRPLFLFDDDPDGLSSFLMLKKFAGKGLGLPLSHSRGSETEIFFERVESYGPDLVMLLDIPVIDQRLIDRLPGTILHLDHHPPLNLKDKRYHYYNPRVENDEDNSPTSYWSYKISKELFWLGMAGMFADWFIPEDLIENFRKKYPGYVKEDLPTPGHAYFETKIGELSILLSFCLKGKVELVRKCIDALEKIEKPEEILEQTSEVGKIVWEHYSKGKKEYDKLLNEALESQKKNPKAPIFYFSYTAATNSYSSLLSTHLAHLLKDKIIMVARVKYGETIMSTRSRSVTLDDKLKLALEGLDGHGGGHPLAVGCGVSNVDFPVFLDRFMKLIKDDLK